MISQSFISIRQCLPIWSSMVEVHLPITPFDLSWPLDDLWPPDSLATWATNLVCLIPTTVPSFMSIHQRLPYLTLVDPWMTSVHLTSFDLEWPLMTCYPLTKLILCKPVPRWRNPASFAVGRCPCAENKRRTRTHAHKDTRTQRHTRKSIII